MLLLAVSKYRKKIGVIYTRTSKKRSFQAIFILKPNFPASLLPKPTPNNP